MRQTIAPPFDFGVTDVGGSGLAGWTVRARELGTTTWTTVATGTDEGAQTANLTGDGETYQVCIQAVDRSGNVADGDYHIVPFAFDDAGGGITYSGTWQTSAPADSYGSTLHTSSEVGASASVTYSNPSVAHLILPPGFDGTARISLNGVDKGSIPASVATMPREIRGFGVDVVDYDSVSPPYTLTFHRRERHVPARRGLDAAGRRAAAAARNPSALRLTSSLADSPAYADRDGRGARRRGSRAADEFRSPAQSDEIDRSTREEAG
jgi:hypothetical protein